MTSTTDRNDLMPPQVFKLEWVTPKISLMVAEDTESKPKSPNERGFGNYYDYVLKRSVYIYRTEGVGPS